MKNLNHQSFGDKYKKYTKEREMTLSSVFQQVKQWKYDAGAMEVGHGVI